MTYTILFVVTVVVVSGLIAYLGDLLGRRMGKKRLTLFGLRPRHTAIVMTTLTGMVIAGLTLVTLLTVFSQLRVVFFRAERIIKENEEYQVRNNHLRELNEKLKQSRDMLTKDVQVKTEQVAQARAQVKNAEKARAQAQKLVMALESRINMEQVELRRLRATGMLTQSRLEVASAKLSVLGGELAVRRTELSKKSAELAQRNTELSTKKRELLSKTNDLLAKAAELDAAETNIRNANEKIYLADIKIDEQRRKLAETTEKLLRGNVVLPQGQELVRTVIPAGSSVNEVRKQLSILLDTASAEAKKAQAGVEGESRAIKLVYEDKETGGQIEDEDACFDAALKAIVEQGSQREDSGILVRVVVANNTLKGKQAPAVIDMFWNNMVFKRGEKIAERPIDGRLSEGRILLAVMDLLKLDVRANASDRGLVPVSGPDPEKSTQAISEEQLDRVMELVETVRQQFSRVKVRAIAKTDIYQADPLTLDNIDFAVSTYVRASR